MSRQVLSQPQRTQNNPLVLGTFSSTAVRYLKGTLGPKNQVIGRADTRYESNGGFGGGSYNHWFQINITDHAWIIVTKGPPRPKYIQVSTYDLNKTPIQGDPIFDADSLTVDSDGNTYIPYLNTVANTQSDLYNTFSTSRIDKGDERYYPLEPGSYLLCVSTTRNEPLNYEVAVVVEFPSLDFYLELEDGDGSICMQETPEPGILPVQEITVDTVIEFPGELASDICIIAAGVTVTIAVDSVWYLGLAIPVSDFSNYKIILEPGNDIYYEAFHDHSLAEWTNAWKASHQNTEKFPEILVPLTNRP